MVNLGTYTSSIFFALVTISASVGYSSPPTTSPSSTAPLTKAQFEQDTGILVWKITGNHTVLSANDDLTDISKPCDMFTLLDSKDAQKLYEARSKDVSPSKLAAADLMKSLGIQPQNYRMNFVQAFKGSPEAPVVLLFPETHLNRQNGELHNSRAWDLFHLTGILEAKKIKIVNTDEGPQGHLKNNSAVNFENFQQRESEVRRVFATTFVTASGIISKVYGDKIEGVYHDRNDLLVKNMLAIAAHENKRAGQGKDVSWIQSLSYMRRQFPTRSILVALEDYKQFFEASFNLPLEDLKQLANHLCEERSDEMAKFVLGFASKKEAKVIYMSFGALHTHGIARHLEKKGVSYIIFSPSL